MAYTLFDALLNLGGALRESYFGAADSGSTTTVVDARFHGNSDFYHEGTILHITKKDAREITTVSGGTVTFTAAFSTAVATGDQYMLIPPTYPKQQMIMAINQALAAMGPVTTYNQAVLVTADTYEYSLAAQAVSNIVRVETTDDTTSPYVFKPNFYWREGNGYLLFKPEHQPTTATAPIRIWYNGAHAWLSALTGEINYGVHPDRLRWEALANLYRWRYHKAGKDEEVIAASLNEAISMAAVMQKLHPIKRMNRDTILAGW